MYEKLKALNQYHRRNGEEEILHKKYIEKRAKATKGIAQKLPSHSKCMFTEGGVKCGDPTLPCCKFCRRHILFDKKQILFQACNVEKSGVICKEPIANILEHSSCFLHIELRPQQSYTLKKYESETEDEDEVLLTPHKQDSNFGVFNNVLETPMNIQQTENESPSSNIKKENIIHDSRISSREESREVLQPQEPMETELPKTGDNKQIINTIDS